MYDFLIFVFPICLGVAAVSDVKTGEIPNIVSLILISVAFILLLLRNAPLNEFIIRGGISITILIICILLFRFSALGGGDGKLLTAVSVWSGPQFTLKFLIIMSLVGGLIALAILLLRQLPKKYEVSLPFVIRKYCSATVGIPYAVAIAVSGIFCWWSHDLI